MANSDQQVKSTVPPFVFAQNVQYVRQRDTFTRADHYGAAVAHHDLLDAALAHPSVKAADLYLDSYSAAVKQSVLASLRQLGASLPDKPIHIRSGSELQELAASRRYVFVTPGVEFLPLAQARLALRGATFPISALVHSIDSPLALGLYVAALLFATEIDAIVATSQAGLDAIGNLLDTAKEFLERKIGYRVSRSVMVRKIPLAVDVAFLQPIDREEARHALHLPIDSTLLLYLGRFSEEQKADLLPLLVCMQRLCRTRPTLRLILAGQDVEGTYTARLRRYAAELGIADRITWLNNFSSSLKPYILSSADIFVSPVDNLQETFGISVLEAMACGLPVIASDWSGYRELVVHGQTGELVPTIWNSGLASRLSSFISIGTYATVRQPVAASTVVDPSALQRAVARLVDNRALCRTYGEAGRQRALSSFSWPVIMSSYESLWHEQWSVASRHNLAQPFVVDYGNIFKQFGTRLMDDNIMLRTVSDIVGLEEAMGVAGISVPSAIKLLERCSLRPLTIRELGSSGDTDAHNNIYWLWKAGFLEEVPL